MADGHWLDPLARSLLEATGQLPARPRGAAASGDQAADRAPGGAQGLPLVQACDDPGVDTEAAAIERELLALKLRRNPGLRLTTATEVRHAAALGWRLDVNRGGAAEWT